MSSTEGRQSPPPEGQTGAQLKDVPASGHGTDEAPDKQNKLQDQLKVRGSSRQPPPPSVPCSQTLLVLIHTHVFACVYVMLTPNSPQNLTSNPKGPIDDALEQKFSKTQEPSTDKN